MTSSSATRTLADFAAGLDARALPDEVREKLGWLLLDYLRVCSIGARLPWSDWSRCYVDTVAAPGRSHALFSNATLNPQHATFLNVAYGSSFDGDDTHVGAMLHPGIAAWAAALATAEHRGATGREVVAAVVAGYETTIRVGLSIQPSHFKRGFQSTGTCSGFGSAVAAARLLSGESQRIAETIGLVAGTAGGLAQFYYSGGSGKRIHAAHAAEAGVAAALLVDAGYAGPTDIIEGQGGFARAYADGFDPAQIEDGLGTRFHLMDVLMKSHAAAARVAAGIDAMLALREAHGFALGDIESVTLGIPAIIEGRLTHPHPVDLQAAQMSLPFTVAVAAKAALSSDGAPVLSVDDFEIGLRDPSIRDLQDRMTIARDDEVEAASSALSTAARVGVRLRDGREVSMLVDAPRGAPSRPFTAAEHDARFMHELSTRASNETCREIVAMSRDLDRLDPAWIGRMLAA